MARTRGERFEGVVQVVILLAIGGTAAAASFTHVHNVAAAHGQPGWLAWADAIVLELMSIATGLEIRRRHRTGRPAGFVLVVLVAGVVLSLAAQVVEAEPSIIGWLAAALPAGGFLALVKIVLTRTSTGPASDPTHPVDPARQDEKDGKDGPDPAEDGNPITRARVVAAQHLAVHGKPITRDQLRTALGVSTDTASALHRELRGLVPVGPDVFHRANSHGGTVHSGAADE